jgi:CRISPR-associated protein Cmr4
MVMERTLLFLYAESPVHAGADSGVGALDMPMQRDGHTRLPVIWGQSLKGALRSHALRRWAAKDVVDAFGSPPPGGDGAEGGSATDEGSGGGRPGGDLKPGTLSIGDAELVVFPVPTVVKTFAWVTSQLALARLRRKASLVGVVAAAAEIGAPDATAAMAADAEWAGETVLGAYVVEARRAEAAVRWARWLSDRALPAGDALGYFRTKLSSDTLIVDDDLLRQLTIECAEVTPRVQLKEKQKTVDHGPFYTEYLPTESLLCAVVEGSAVHVEKVRTLLNGQVLRIGGDETIGKGLTWCRFAWAGAS